MSEVRDLGEKKNFEVFDSFVSAKGKFIVDTGCGSMTIAKELAARGARVLAVDPDPIQAEKNRNSEVDSRIQFVETGADKIPLEDGTADGVVFGYSLHHIPAELYPAVFAEVLRLLKGDGFLYFIEPTACPLNEVMKLFHDEDQERAAAQLAIRELAAPHFEQVDFVRYHSFTEFDSFEHFAELSSSRSFNSHYAEADVRAPAVRAEFEKQAAPNYRFEVPKNVACLRGRKPTA